MSAVLSAVQPQPADSEAVERELRVQLAAYRLVEHFGWSVLICGHLTVRIPGETPTFLMNAMILRNHGILTGGRTIPEAFIWLYRLERACQAQLDAMAAGRLHIIDSKVVEHSARETARFLESEAAVGELEFQALMRKLDRIDPSYRH